MNLLRRARKDIDIYVKDVAVIAVSLDSDEIRDKVRPIVQQIDLDQESKISFIEDILDEMVDEAFRDREKIIVDIREYTPTYVGNSPSDVFYQIEEELEEEKQEREEDEKWERENPQEKKVEESNLGGLTQNGIIPGFNPGTDEK